MTSELILTLVKVLQESLLSLLLYMYYNADLLDLIENKVNRMSLEFIDDIIYEVKGDMNIGNVYRIKKMLMKAEK